MKGKTGVDITYLLKFIDTARDLPPEKLTSTYVAEVLDRIFE